MDPGTEAPNQSPINAEAIATLQTTTVSEICSEITRSPTRRLILIPPSERAMNRRLKKNTTPTNTATMTRAPHSQRTRVQKTDK